MTLQERLLRVLDAKNHWAWPAFAGGEVALPNLLPHFQQEWEVYIRDFPVLLARVLGKGPPAPVRGMLAANLYEEQTGAQSGTAPHPDLFLRMMEGCGFSSDDFHSVKLLPAAAAYRQFLDAKSLDEPWTVGAAVLTLFVEGSVNERKELAALAHPPPSPAEIDEAIQRHPLVRFHHVHPSAMELVRAHKRVEGGHRRDAWEMVLSNVTPDTQHLVVAAMDRALELWLSYRDDVARACGIAREAS